MLAGEALAAREESTKAELAALEETIEQVGYNVRGESETAESACKQFSSQQVVSIGLSCGQIWLYKFLLRVF